MVDIAETRNLTLAGGLKVLHAAMAEAERIGRPMCIAVVDAGGKTVGFSMFTG